MNTVYFAVPGNLNTLTGGYGYDRRLIEELRRLGCPIKVLTLAASFPNPDAAALTDADAQLSALPEQAVVVVDGLAYGAMEEIAEKQARRLCLIALCHHPLMLETGLAPALVRQREQSERRALQVAAAVVVTSPATARSLTELFEIPQSHISVALPGTDPQPYAPCNGSPPVLLTVATLTPRKAHDVLIDALASLTDLPWQARWVGGTHFDPDWVRQLQQKVRDSKLEERVTWVGEITDPASEYAGADLFVLPSHYEGYGMVFAEALSFGLPVVGTQAGAIPGVVPPGAGILVPPGDAAALAVTLRQLLVDVDLRARLQQGARDSARQLPRWHDAANTVIALIKRLRLSSP
ncbi:MAG TPA: glycosyltransferase family 4 protein [Dongiaceae bacterium]|nr:glycosyltransferase family 4 protein [Dongiaceae bacterium]